MNNNEAKQIAQTILAQLGGNKFLVMTGAKYLAHHEDGSLGFQLPNARKANGIKHVRITLNSLDLYDMKFWANGKHGLNSSLLELDPESNIYDYMLRDRFTARTGLYTSLGTMGQS